jgi:hypothetical protein
MLSGTTKCQSMYRLTAVTVAKGRAYKQALQAFMLSGTTKCLAKVSFDRIWLMEAFGQPKGTLEPHKQPLWSTITPLLTDHLGWGLDQVLVISWSYDIP